MNLNIGIDIDGVITDESHENDNIWHHKLCQFLGRDIKRKRDSYSFIEAYDLPQEIINVFLKEHLEEIYSGVKPAPDAKETIIDLYNIGFNIYLITARHQEFEQLTRDWLGKMEIPYTELFHEDKKGPLAEKLGIRLFIEDNSENALDLSSRDIQVLLVNKYHNKDLSQDENIYRVNNWQEIKEYIYNIFQLSSVKEMS